MPSTAYKINKYTLLVSITLLSFSCTSTKKVYKHLTSTPASLSYIQDSKLVESKLAFHVELDSVYAPLENQSIALLDKTKSSTTPLLIYNDWKYEFDYKVGYNSYQENLSSFIQESFINESSRSGVFQSKDKQNDNSEYRLSIHLEENYATGPLKVDGMFLYLLVAYSISENQMAGPGKAFTKFKYTLKKGNEVVLESSVESESLTEPLQAISTSSKKLRQDFNTSLVEATSMTIKENISKIVSELNSYFKSI